MLEGKKVSEIFKKTANEGKIIMIPQFSKKIEVHRGGQVYAGRMALSWKEYIKSSRYFGEPEVVCELVGPFYCAVLELDAEECIRFLFGSLIKEEEIKR